MQLGQKGKLKNYFDWLLTSNYSYVSSGVTIGTDHKKKKENQCTS